MKFKIGAILLVGLFMTIIIYLKVDNNDINFLSLGDGIATGMTPYHIEGYDYNDYLSEYLSQKDNVVNYYKNFSEPDETVVSLLNKIADNISTLENKIKIKQAIQKSDVITIALGMDELNSYASKKILGSSKITGYLNKYEELFQKITQLNKNKIFVISLYESNLIAKDKISKINTELEKLCQKYSITFIDISDIRNNSEFFIQKNSYYPNYKGQKYIFEKIISSFTKETFSTI